MIQTHPKQLPAPSSSKPKQAVHLSSLKNQALYDYCSGRLREKAAENVSLLYLRVLTTAIIRYDEYLASCAIENFMCFDQDAYQRYLEECTDSVTGERLSQKYIHFLVGSIQMLLRQTD